MSEPATETETYVITSGWDAVTMTLTRTMGPAEPLSEEDKRLLAWQGPFPPCRTCGRVQNRRCATPTGKEVLPHQHRRDMVDGYLARSGEIAALKNQLDASTVAGMIQ